MHPFQAKRFYFILLMIGFCAVTHAQVYDTIPGGQYEYDREGRPLKKDSTNETLQHRDIYEDSITIFYHYWDSTRIGKLDSSINDFYTRFPVSWRYYDLGNFGSAAKSFIFQPDMKPGFDAGFHSYDIYRYTPEGTRFFQTTRPYSETIYLLGSRTEQMINLFHTQNRKSNFNIGLDFRVISSPGAYKNQSTTTSNTRVNTFFQTKNKRYINNFIFITNKILSSENGGLQPGQNLDSLFMNNPVGAETKLGSGLNTVKSIFGATVAIGTEYKDLTLVMRHSYDFGQKDSLVTDSVTYKLFYPRVRLQHTMWFSKNSYEYHDVQPPVAEDYYNYMQYQVASGTDTIKFNDTWQNLTNDFAIISYPQKNNLNQYLKLNAGYEYIKGESAPITTTYNNIYAAAEYRNRTRNQLYDIEASGKLYVAGHYAGDYAAYISFTRSLRKNIGSLQVGFQNVNRTPSFIEGEYSTDTNGIRQSLSAFPVVQQGSFNKENITRLFAVIDVPPADLRLTAEYYLVTNFTYFNSLYSSKQSSSLFNVLDIGAQKKLRVTKHFNWYLEGNLQQPTGNPPVNLPLVFGRSRFAFEGNFLKNLSLSTGLEVRYNTPYKADDYSPLTGQFVLQDTSTISNRPDINLFLNFRIKSFKGFIRLENLNTIDFSNFTFTKYNYSAPGYPQRGFWLRLGVWWSFVN
jgi:Putative porin